MELINRKILNNVESVIKKRQLVSAGDKVLVAFSGGSDSVLLLRILHALAQKYNFTVAAAHLNHSLREEADSEELFSKKLCEEIGIEFFSKKADINNIANLQKISEETAGRNERYTFFEELRQKYGFTKIATAHHRDDNAETILMHFIRGSGVRGLSGIEYSRGIIIRPILELSKADIIECCTTMGWQYVTDKSNFETVYKRNRVRLELIPEMNKYNPAFSEVITANAPLFAEDDDFLNMYTEETLRKNMKGDAISKSLLDRQHRSIARRIVQLMYKAVVGKEQNLSQKYINSVLEISENGKEISLPGNMLAKLESDMLSIGRKEEKKEPFEYKITLGESIYIPQTGKYWIIRKAGKKDKKVFYLPSDAELIIRSRKNGDVFYPTGMTGKKTLSNFFTDKKIPRDKRDEIPILTADGEVVCIGGVHYDRRFYNSDTSFNVYCLEIYDN